MERSGSQKFLLVISILDIIVGILGLIGAIMFITLGAGTNIAEVADPASMAEAGITASDASAAAGVMGIVGIVALFSGALCLLQGILGVRAANDNQKIMPVWVIALIGLICAAVGIIMGLIDGSFGTQAWSLVGSLAGSLLMFWVANNIKREAGK